MTSTAATSAQALGTNWPSALRDLFLATGEFKIVGGKLHKYVDGLWEPHPYEDVGILASKYLDENTFLRPSSGRNMVPLINDQKTRRELTNALWSHGDLYDAEFFANAPPGLAVGDRFIVVSETDLDWVPLTSAHRARQTLQVSLPQRLQDVGEPKVYLSALRRVFGDDEDGERKILAFQEFLGACRTGIVTSYERCIIMPGGGSNGKSTIIMGAAESLFNKSEVRSIIPNFLNQEYYLMQLREAALNMVTELPKEQINCTERFKQTISGEDVTGRPIREMPVTFRPLAGHIFACNNFPKLSDNSKGMWRRLLVLRADAAIPKADGLRADLVNKFKAESAEILVWALRGAQRLMRQGDYTFPVSHEEEAKTWQGTNDKALQFVNNCTHGLGSGWCKASVAHKLYSDWHYGMGYPVNEKLDSTGFGAALRHIEGFDYKRQSFGMAYNFVLKPKSKWLDYADSTNELEVKLEEEAK